MKLLKIFSKDEKSQQQEKERPSPVGYLLFSLTKTSFKFQSTAVVVGEDLLLTTASSVYSKSRQRRYQFIKFYWPTNKETPKEYEVSSFRFHHRYLTSNSSSCDYALLKLSSKISMPQYYKLQVLKGGEALSLLGFVPNASVNRAFIPQQLTIRNRSTNSENLEYQVDNELGIAGAPLVNKRVENEWTVCGIHRGSFQRSGVKVSLGVPVTSHMINDLLAWEKQMFQFNTFLKIKSLPSLEQTNQDANTQTLEISLLHQKPQQSIVNEDEGYYRSKYQQICEQIEQNEEELAELRAQRRKEEQIQLKRIFEQHYCGDNLEQIFEILKMVGRNL